MRVNWGVLSQWIIVILMAAFFFWDKTGSSSSAVAADISLLKIKTQVIESTVAVKLENIDRSINEMKNDIRAIINFQNNQRRNGQ